MMVQAPPYIVLQTGAVPGRDESHKIQRLDHVIREPFHRLSPDRIGPIVRQASDEVVGTAPGSPRISLTKAQQRKQRWKPHHSEIPWVF
jgi:hypothetical protein